MFVIVIIITIVVPICIVIFVIDLKSVITYDS